MNINIQMCGSEEKSQYTEFSHEHFHDFIGATTS